VTQKYNVIAECDF